MKRTSLAHMHVQAGRLRHSVKWNPQELGQVTPSGWEKPNARVQLALRAIKGSASRALPESARRVATGAGFALAVDSWLATLLRTGIDLKR